VLRLLQVGAERCDEELGRQFVVLLIGCVGFDGDGHALEAIDEAGDESAEERRE
jgi:hypothetical protein